MALRDLVPWTRDRQRQVPVQRAEHPVSALQHEMNRVFDEFWRGFGAPSLFEGEDLASFRPRVDVEETDDSVVVTAELAGLEEKDFELELVGDALVLRGEKQQEARGRDGWYERAWGSFQRAIPLPCEVEREKTSARFRNGVLRVELPKAKSARERRRRIEVRSH